MSRVKKETKSTKWALNTLFLHINIFPLTFGLSSRICWRMSLCFSSSLSCLLFCASSNFYTKARTKTHKDNFRLTQMPSRQRWITFNSLNVTWYSRTKTTDLLSQLAYSFDVLHHFVDKWSVDLQLLSVGIFFPQSNPTNPSELMLNY